MRKITPLFDRNLTINSFNKNYIEKLQNKLTLHKLNNWNPKKTWNLFDINYEQEYLAYRFFILKEWIKQNQSYTQNFVNGLYQIISNLVLDNFLNTQEKNFINEFKSVVFAKNRNIKNLIVDFDLLDKEEVWYTYDILGLYQKTNKYKFIINNIQVFFTNQRIIFASNANLYKSINYDEISCIKLQNNFLKIITNDDELIIAANEITTMYVSLERIGKLIRKNI